MPSRRTGVDCGFWSCAVRALANAAAGTFGGSGVYLLRKIRVGVIDLVHNAPTRALYARVMHANLASIMPQVVANWCQQLGHRVDFVCYTGLENLKNELPDDCDVVFICGFTQSAQLAYALSNLFRSRGAVTALGGPHARCYPEDAQRYFDYVLGFTDRALIQDVLQDCSQHRPRGLHLSADRQPGALPTLAERWPFVEMTLAKAPLIKIVPMIGSLGCPYACPFCIDACVPYQPLDLDSLQADLRFLSERMARPRVGWHDPNFGVRFDECLDAIEDAVPPGSVDFVAESSLTLLTEPHVERLQRNGFKALLPGVESWYDMGRKSRCGDRQAGDRVRYVSEQINMIMRYVPYVQANFVVGLDSDTGAEPFELTKRFIDSTPGVFPGFSLLTAFGRAAPLNLELQLSDRVIPFPFHFLDNNHAMNVRPLNYSWAEFYDHLIDLQQHAFSRKSVWRRFRANRETIPRWMNVVRGISSEGSGRLREFRRLRHRLDTDDGLRSFLDRESNVVPAYYTDAVRQELGSLWEWLPAGAMEHDPNAYLKASREGSLAVPASVVQAMAVDRMDGTG
jgi:hypothetical protein